MKRIDLIENEEIINEAVKIAKDYPELTINEVIEKAKEVITIVG